MEKCRVCFHPEDRCIEVDKGENLLRAAMEAGVHINASCGGEGYCGKCRVIIESGEVTQKAQVKLSEEEVNQGYVLACQSTINSDLEVRVPIESQIGDKGVLARRPPIPLKGYTLSAKDWAERLPQWELNPPTTKFHLVLGKPTLEDNLSDAERIKRELSKLAGLENVVMDYPLLQALPSLIRASSFDVTVTVLDRGQELRAVRLEKGDTSQRQAAIAVDLGTTTISAQLIDLQTGKVIAEETDYNGQITYGEDIISRIIYSTRATGLAKLQSVAVNTIWNLIQQMVEKTGIEFCSITHLVVSGNTVMTHLLLGLDPRYIRVDPYIPVAQFFPWIKASNIGIRIASGVYLKCTPCVASYVGGDIVAGVLASGMFNSEKLTLYVDIGTNGEIALGNKDWLIACSCSAGPAFEGGGVRHGMRATRGAIEQVRINEVTLEPMIITIGNRRPLGICGSGLIDLLSELFLSGIVDERGKIKTDLPTPRVREGDLGGEYVIAWAEESGTGRDIYISDVDIDNLMRAKAAIFAGINVLLEEVGLDIEMVEEILIAGAFGRYLEIDKAIIIGLLPDVDVEKIKFVGNGSLLGSYLLALSKNLVVEADKIADKMTYLELSTSNRFMEQYVSALFLPHTHAEKFPTVMERLKEAREMAKLGRAGVGGGTS
ncbi:MAG: ASKHA domain-containing protein [Actinomycetota bacterium]|nr:ASKHA domain-containing protein [Actinomycetota bacterium]